MASVTETQPMPHRFGDVAKSMGLVNDEILNEARRKQHTLRTSGGKSRLGEVLIMMNVLTVEQVKKVLSEQRKRRAADQEKELPVEYFGEFKLIEKLGEGGMGTVYKAQETLANRMVALKVLKKNYAGNTGFVERFDREAKLAGSLSHPNIVACHSAGTNRGVQYMVMEFIDGETLKGRVKREGGKLPEKETLRILREVALGLSHAHSKGVVHRDVKPDNVLLGKDGSIKISDFGTAKSFLDNESITSSGVVVGTPHYISPEQVRADKNIDHRADLYSMGATMYHLMTGRVPFDAPNSLEIMRRHLQEDLENPADINPDLSFDTVQIVSKLMAKRPERRYQSATDLAEDISRVLGGQVPLHATLAQNESTIRAPIMRRAHKKKSAGCMGMLALTLLAAAAAHALGSL